MTADAPQTTNAAGSSSALTDAGEIFLLACATMNGMEPFGRGSARMAAGLLRRDLVISHGGKCFATTRGLTALKQAGYTLA